MTWPDIAEQPNADVVSIERSAKTIAPAGNVLHETTFRVRFHGGDALVLWNLPGDGGPGRFEDVAAWLGRQTGVGLTRVEFIDLRD